jgi:hypothetical protein
VSLALSRRDHLPVDSLALLGEPLDERCCVDYLAAALRERLALLEGHDPCQVLLPLVHEPRGLEQDAGAVLGGSLSPFTLRLRSSVYGPPHLRLTAIGQRGEHLTVRRVHDVEGLAGGGGLDPLAADEEPVAQYGLGHDASRRDLHVFRISAHQSNPETGAAPY